MWTTSNSRGKRPRLARLCASAAFALLVAFATQPERGVASAQEVAPDAPRPARPPGKPPSALAGRGPQLKRVELRSLTVGRPNGRMAQLAGKDFMGKATNPLVIEVRTQDPLGDLTRTSSPVIVLNGETLSETIPLKPNRLIAFIPDRRKIKDTNTVVVEWLGQEQLTRSRRPLTFRSRDVK
jgi:hypothetical protein